MAPKRPATTSRQTSTNHEPKRPRSRGPAQQGMPVSAEAALTEISNFAQNKWKFAADSDGTPGNDEAIRLTDHIYRQYLCTEEALSVLRALDEHEYMRHHLWPLLCSLFACANREGRSCEWEVVKPLTFSVLSLFMHRQYSHPARAVDYLDAFDHNPEAVSDLIEALFRLDLRSLSTSERITRLNFLCEAFRSLDCDSFRKALLPLLSLPVWIHLSERSFQEQLDSFPHLRKPLEKVKRRARRGNRNGLQKLPDFAAFSLVRELEEEAVSVAFEPHENKLSIVRASMSVFAELLSQRRLRRTLLPLLTDRGTLYLLQGVALQLSGNEEVKSKGIWTEWVRSLDHLTVYMTFPVDSASGTGIERDSIRKERSRRLLALQKVAHSASREGGSNSAALTNIALGSRAVIGDSKNLRDALTGCADKILQQFGEALEVDLLNLVLSVRAVASSANLEARSLFSQRLFVSAVASYCAFQEDAIGMFRAAPLMISEQDLWGQFGANESRPSQSLPILNLEFLNLQDYLLRNFVLYKMEYSWAIREDIENAIARMRPRFVNNKKEIAFSGWAKTAAPLASITVKEVGQELLDSPGPSYVLVQLQFETNGLPRNLRLQWDKIREHEVLFLVRFEVPVGYQDDTADVQELDDLDLLFSNCLVRGVVMTKSRKASNEAHEALDVESQQLLAASGTIAYGFVDPLQYHYDLKAAESSSQNPYEGFHLVVRRDAQSNSFYPVLSAIRELILSDQHAAPKWAEEIVLGHRLNHSPQAPVRDEDPLDMVDTFVSEEHVKSSFPATDVNIRPCTEMNCHSHQSEICYQIEIATTAHEKSVTATPYHFQAEKILYNSQLRCRRNQTKFSSDQVQAISNAQKNGMTIIVGPPGTGKTSCIVQIVFNLYHAMPRERILIIARTNHTLNDLVQKLLRRDIDPCLVLLLGQGHSGMPVEQPLSTDGRVNALLQRRLDLLSLVSLLCRLDDEFSDDEKVWTCESAKAFYEGVVKPKWEAFQRDSSQDWASFPFRNFIEQVNKHLRDEQKAKRDMNYAFDDASIGRPKHAYQFISNLFEEIDTLRFLEVLRTTGQRSNYLVATYSRIIAMTSIHAAIYRRELLAQGFTYDTIVMEEAAQMLEIEAFLCLHLQRSGRLRRVVLVGDDNQLPPVVQDITLHQRCNYGQSMFSRFVRLENEVTELKYQGHSRISLANLFRWQYHTLEDMERIKVEKQFAQANPGFRYSSQFIDTGELNSESEPLPHFFQNLVEAEYIAFVFLYMRLLGYPCNRIAVLAMYTGQVELLRECIASRSAQYGNLGLPAVISTLDKFQGRQADYVLLSLVRTRSLGSFRDTRRITVALSRARLGLYMFGFFSLFSSSPEFAPVLSRLRSPHTLTLVAQEAFTKLERMEDDEIEDKDAIIREVHSPADMAAIVSHLSGGGA